MNNYLIPANSKKSMLILGFFTPIDLIIFGLGCTFTLVMLFMFNSKVELSAMLLFLAPALVTGFLVMPVPYYHNILQLLTNVVTFIFGRKRFYWRGWCVNNGEE